MNSKEAWKDERNLDDEIPFAYAEGEFSCPCSYIEDYTECPFVSEEELINENKKIYLKAIEEFGANKQIVVAIEELSELQKELCKFLRYETTTNLSEEIADVGIMLEQLKIIFGIEEVVEQDKRFKINRLAKSLVEEIK